jgi:hypothetical protein
MTCSLRTNSHRRLSPKSESRALVTSIGALSPAAVLIEEEGQQRILLAQAAAAADRPTTCPRTARAAASPWEVSRR